MERSSEFRPPATNWLARAYYTPVSDALRGHLSARLDVRREIAAAGLPQPISALVYAVVRRTRLWRSEKLDVARELAAHFADGLSAGRSAEQLIDAFGPAEQAARLIRKAKRRGRPRAWQMWWYISRGFLVFLGVGLVVYISMAARFYLSSPQIARNFCQEINTARRVEEADRAWPLYREAAFKLGKDDSSVIGEYLFAEPDSKHWPQLVDALERHKESIELVRQGARKPALGALLGDAADHAASRAAGAEWLIDSKAPLAGDNPELISVNLNFAQSLRSLARLMAADARRAAVAGDGQAVLADLSALVAISEQAFQPHATLVEQLIGLAIFGLAVETVERILADQPEALDEGQLRDLAHRIAVWRDGDIHADFTGERDMFYDLLQRIYTDDGRGDGRVTPEGVRGLHSLVESAPPALNPDVGVLSQLISPGVAALVGGRRENRELYDSLLDEMIAAHQGPPWQWDYEDMHAGDDRLKRLTGTATGALRYFLPYIMLPAVSAVFSADERAIANRDAALVSIALVLYHRRHGQWPASLDQLVPDLLPAVPPDRLDGKPLRYTLRDGRPILYTLGGDRDDDGGRPTDPPENATIASFGPRHPQASPSPPGGDDDGDWIFFPPPKEPEEDDAE
jgi:hypothetical protein